MDAAVEAHLIRRRIALVVFGVLGVFLFSSEFMNAVFNNRLDARGVALGSRLVFAFKPTVVGIYLVFALILYLLIVRYLRPLLRFLVDGTCYEEARTAAINVPRVIIAFQLTAWTVGTLLYYMLKGWEAESGIPVWFGLPLKIAVGLPAGVYTSILFNLTLIRAKARLRITSLGTGENDRFSRNRDYWAVAAILVFVVVNLAYVSYYFALSTAAPDARNFYVPMLCAAAFYGGVSFGLIALSKREYFIQIESIRSTLERIVAGDRNLDSRIAIINYNELGEIAGTVNLIVDNFVQMLDRIGESAGIVLSSSRSLSNASHQQSVHANEQAAGAASIVQTMEEVDSHSKEIGSRAQNVEEAAQQMRTDIDAGSAAANRTIETMGDVRSSHAQLIERVQDLNARVRDIWEVVTIITGVARRIRMIAFNATLQASAAGKAGKGFEVVANEIRKLAEESVSSTADIDSRVQQVQAAADSLVETAQEDADRIHAAFDLTSEQKTTFESLLELSDTTAEAAESMSQRVSQQFDAFGRVLSSLKSISSGTTEFSSSIRDSNQTARSLSETVEMLEGIVRGEGRTSSRSRGDPVRSEGATRRRV